MSTYVVYANELEVGKIKADLYETLHRRAMWQHFAMQLLSFIRTTAGFFKESVLLIPHA